MELAHLHIIERNDDDIDHFAGARVVREPHPNTLADKPSDPKLIPFYFGVRAYDVVEKGVPPTISWEEEGQPILWIPLALSPEAATKYDPTDVVGKLICE